MVPGCGHPEKQENQRKEESESHSVMSTSLQPHKPYRPWNSPGQNTGVGTLSLLQGIFPTQGSNPGLPHCRQILNQLSHKGSLSFWLNHTWNFTGIWVCISARRGCWYSYCRGCNAGSMWRWDWLCRLDWAGPWMAYKGVSTLKVSGSQIEHWHPL